MGLTQRANYFRICETLGCSPPTYLCVSEHAFVRARAHLLTSFTCALYVYVYIYTYIYLYINVHCTYMSIECVCSTQHTTFAKSLRAFYMRALRFALTRSNEN